MVFVVVPVGEKWAVCSGGEVIATAETAESAWDLAQKATDVFRPASRLARAPDEPRSFALRES